MYYTFTSFTMTLINLKVVICDICAVGVCCCFFFYFLHSVIVHAFDLFSKNRILKLESIQKVVFNARIQFYIACTLQLNGFSISNFFLLNRYFNTHNWCRSFSFFLFISFFLRSVKKNTHSIYITNIRRWHAQYLLRKSYYLLPTVEINNFISILFTSFICDHCRVNWKSDFKQNFKWIKLDKVFGIEVTAFNQFWLSNWKVLLELFKRWFYWNENWFSGTWLQTRIYTMKRLINEWYDIAKK